MADLADYFIDTERPTLCALSFLAHKLDRAIRNAVKLLGAFGFRPISTIPINY
jgi:hypothetical protein